METVRTDNSIAAWTPAMVWTCIILLFSLLPGTCVPLTVGGFDKAAHFFEYAVLAILMLKGIYRSGWFSSRQNDLFTLITGTLYGILMELLQRFVPGRTPAIDDAVSNFIGMVFGLIIWKTILWRK